MRHLTLILMLLWFVPVEAAKCPIYSYLPQPGQHPSGLLKLDLAAERVLLAQIPDPPIGKICWYASTDGTLSARQPDPTKVYIFRLDNGRLVYVESHDVITVVG